MKYSRIKDRDVFEFSMNDENYAISISRGGDEKCFITGALIINECRLYWKELKDITDRSYYQSINRRTHPKVIDQLEEILKPWI